MSGFGSYAMKKHVKSSPARSSTAMTAVALQDHILRNLSLSDGLLKPPSQRRLGKPRPKKEIKATIDTGRGRNVPKKIIQHDKEYVLDAQPPKPTLAQKMGLVEAPPQLLSEADWSSVKAKSSERKDFSHPCVICKEHIGSLEQVLLSCSHVFHRPCLEAFERFSGRKTCPMCRKEQYQTRVVHEGSKQYRIRCATMIQAAWRGYVVRCWYKKLRETVPPKDPKLRQKFYEDKLSTINDRMIKSCDYDLNGFLAEIDRNLQASRDIFRHFDNAAKIISEDEWFDIQLMAVQRGNKECPICLNALSSQPITEDDAEICAEFSSKAQQKLTALDKRTAPRASSAIKLKSKNPTNLKLQPASRTNTGNSTKLPGIVSSKKKTAGKPVETTKKKSPRDAFCEKIESTFDYPDMKSASQDVISKQNATSQDALSKLNATSADAISKQTVLLSCSHVFHETCLNAFEEFSVGDRRFVCPVCRAVYQKKVIDLSS